MAVSVFSAKRTVVALQILYGQIQRSAISMGDLPLCEYYVLAAVHETGGRLSLRQLKEKFRKDSLLDVYVSSLELKELVSRVRDPKDRRGFALEISMKGAQRIASLDWCVSTEVMKCNPRLNERSFLRLATSMHSLAGPPPNAGESDLIFTSHALFLLDMFHNIVMRDSSYFGMTSLQAALLCLFDKQGVFHAENLKSLSGLSEDALEYQFDALASNGLIKNDANLEILQKGNERLGLLSGRLESTVHALLQDTSVNDRRRIAELCECCVYLLV